MDLYMVLNIIRIFFIHIRSMAVLHSYISSNCSVMSEITLILMSYNIDMNN